MYTVNVVVSSSALSRFSISSSVGSGVSSLGAASPPPNFFDGVSCASRSMFQSNLPITRFATVRNESFTLRFLPPGARSMPRAKTVTKALSEKA